MIRLLRSSLFILLLAQVFAQDAATVERQIELLRQQLRDVTDKQAQLQARVQELDEALKPENIEKSVAGVGTTDAAALRDQRREQLERQKAVVEEQLRSLDASRARLEASIASAEAEAVRMRADALGASNQTPKETGTSPRASSSNTRAASASPSKRKARRAVRRRVRARGASSRRRG